MTANTQVYLIFEAGGSPPDADIRRLQSALGIAPVASALIRSSTDARLDAKLAEPLIVLLRRHGITTLVADDVALARAVKSDGVHISWSKETAKFYREARASLGPEAIIGADAGRSRHDAMLLGETGADYVAFGIPTHVGDRHTAEGRQLDLVAWWSEIFEIPCVAFDVATVSQAQALSRAKADFVAITISETESAEEVTSTVHDFADAMLLRREPV